MGSGTTHNLDEVPVLLSGVGITLDITDNLGICLCSCIETERSLDVLVLKVTVDRLGAADNLDACVICSHVLSESSCVCVGVVTADDDDSCEAVLLSIVCNSLELLNCLELCSAGTDDIESACVPVCVDELVVELYIIILKKSVRTALESEKNVLGICSLKCVIKTGDDIVSARSLSARKDNAYDLLLCLGSVSALYKCDLGLTVCIGKKCLDLLLICNTLCATPSFTQMSAMPFLSIPGSLG